MDNDVIIVVAGTFDPIHDGHKAMIRKCFEHTKSDSVLIGIMTDDYVRNVKHREPTEYSFRRKEVIRVCDEIIREGFKFKPCRIREVQSLDYSDWYLVSRNVKYIVLSTEKDYTDWINKINKMRRKSKLGYIKTVIVPCVTDEKGVRISSTSIREAKP